MKRTSFKRRLHGRMPLNLSPFSFDNLKLVTRKKMFERFHLKVLVVFFSFLLSFFLSFFCSDLCGVTKNS